MAKLLAQIQVDKNIKVHAKASERYLSVKFSYPDCQWEGWIPIEYRRTNLNIDISNDDKLIDHLNKLYEQMNP